jgi:hypothetical protein
MPCYTLRNVVRIYIVLDLCEAVIVRSPEGLLVTMKGRGQGGGRGLDTHISVRVIM